MIEYQLGVRLLGNVELGQDVSIGGPAEINAQHSRIVIGDGCDIASYVTITTADSHLRTLGFRSEVDRAEVIIGDHVFIGQGALILKGTTIGHHCVIGAGVVLSGQSIPPWSRVRAPEPHVDCGHYDRRPVTCQDDEL